MSTPSLPSLPASSVLAVAGQPSPSLDLENSQGSQSSTSTQSRTPGLSWDSQPTTVTFGEPQLKSIFEDWDDGDDDAAEPSCKVVIEEDGVQALLLTPASPFFHQPPSPRPFGYEPFSRGLRAADVPIQQEETHNEVPPGAYVTLTPAMFHLAPQQPSPKAPRGRMLFIDTSSPARNSFSISAFIYSAPSMDDIPSWAPKQLLGGPDVPLEVDCVYSASGVSPIDHWEEKLWSPIIFGARLQARLNNRTRAPVMSSSTTTPVSESSEGSALRAFVDETIAKDRLQAAQAAASMSPRSALLSHTSRHRLEQAEESSASLKPNYGALEKRRPPPRKRSAQRRTQSAATNELPLTTLSKLELELLRKDPRAEALRLHNLLNSALQQAQYEAKRAADLERANLENAQKFRVLNENRISAQQEAARATEEITLYKFQLENAKQEVNRAEEALKRTEKEREEAEEAAARARAKARKLRQEQLVAAAREEGRRLGFDLGFEHAKKEREILARRQAQISTTPSLATGTNSKGKGKQRADGNRSSHRRHVSAPPAVADDIQSSPESEMSPSMLPLRSLPEVPLPMNPPSAPQPGPSRTPLRQFQPPPESAPPTPAPVPPSVAPSEPYARTKTPSVQHWQIDIPTPDQIARQYNSNEHRNGVIPTQPRSEWVTASKHREIRGPVPPGRRAGNIPPPLLPPQPQPPRQPVIPDNPPTSAGRAARFALLTRPSLAKTKQQATSWYRSLSMRRKKKPVIDPIAEEPSAAGPSTLEPPATASTVNPPTTASTLPGGAGGSEEMYGTNLQPPSSWYQAKYSSAPVPPSIRSQDYAPSRRPTSQASTRVSQFDLLATPGASQSVGSLGLGLGKGKVKEKDSFLSAIKEDPSSRGNTPSTDRYGRPTSSVAPVPQPVFRQSQQGLQNQSSYGTFEGSVQNMRRSRRPPSIVVPDPDAPLQPAGVAYAQHAMASKGHPPQGYQPSLHRHPSRISEKTTPDTSIAIDVVPPSGIAPPPVNSPPHTGRNHLSPYHVFKPASMSNLAPMQSVTSLQSQGGTRQQPPASNRAPSVAVSHQRSNQTLNTYGGPSQQQGYSSTPKMKPKASSTFSAAGPNESPSVNEILYARASGSPLPPPQMPAVLAEGQPESIRSGHSRRALRSRNPSQTSLVVVNPDPPTRQSPTRPTSGMSRRPGPNPVVPAAQESSGLVLQAPIQRQASNTSLRSTNSYSKFVPQDYVDPAFWGVNGPGEGPAVSAAANGDVGALNASRLSRQASANSGLSYV
ncbi:hypothetical protein NLJ89_g9268 [Agrocybe chaxingu]|uniref:Uncharacterized protein n=1 Tax=Agrocybe chaxingu TaxID=84603 RepID=A0A9W8JTV4_9AGAR|nr:hypothetical protein NLJ89_g9268 [Agrocybe chaxingu]